MESSLENLYKESPKNVIVSANKLADLLLIFFSPMTMILVMKQYLGFLVLKHYRFTVQKLFTDLNIKIVIII